MPKPRRFTEAGYIYHIIARGNNKQNIFLDPQDFQKYSSFLEKARRKFPVKIYNYALMHNHVHLLVEPIHNGGFSKMMESTGKNYAKYFNQKYNHMGHVFQGRFKSFVILNERYFFICHRYIDLNPLKANIVSDPKYYIWSGYQTLAFGEKGCIEIDLHDLYLNLGNTPIQRQAVYRSIVWNNQSEDIDFMNRREGALK